MMIEPSSKIAPEDPKEVQDSVAKRRYSAVRYQYYNSNSYDNTTSSATVPPQQQMKRKRQGHLMVLLPLTKTTSGTDGQQRRVLEEFRLYNELSAFLAYQHLTKRSGQVLPHLPQRLEDCDFEMTYQHHDSQYSPLQAAKELLTYNYQQSTTTTTPKTTMIGSDGKQTITTTISNDDENDEDGMTRQQQQQQQQQQYPQQQQQPFAIMGAARSAVSTAVSEVGAALELPQISSSSTARALNDSPLFARTIVTDEMAARSMMSYLYHMGVTHTCLLYVKDSWGIAYAQNAAHWAGQLGIQLNLIPYNIEEASSGRGLDRILQLMSEDSKISGYRYFVGAISSSGWKSVLHKLYRHDLLGPFSNRQWYFAEMTEVLRDGFVLESDTKEDMELALALNGIGILSQKLTPHTAFDRALQDFTKDEALQQEFIRAHREPHLLMNYTFDLESMGGRSLFQYLTYDAVIALGITACETPGLFTGQEFYNNLLRIDFDGVTGRVQLDSKTGTRTEDAFEYEVVNVVLKNPTTTMSINDTATTTTTTTTRAQEPYFSFDTTTSAVVRFPQNVTEGAVTRLQPFTYYDNTHQPPNVLPPLNANLNLIPKSVIGIGYGLGGFVMIMSIGWAIWIFLNQKKQVVAAAQPIFLYQLCFGTFLTATAIIPLSFQEDMPGLDQACRATPWFLCIGFCVAITALLSKSTRITKLMKSGTGFRRIKVKAVDVMRPFAILMTINVVLLTAWTASPYRLSWHRLPLENYDEFGRRVESVGLCRPDGRYEYLAFALPLMLTNAIVLALAASRTYQARNLPTDFSEASYLFITVISLTETVLLGGTTSLAVMNHPTSFYIVVCIIICLGCMAILLPMFIPKYYRRNERNRRSSLEATIMNYNVNETNMMRGPPSLSRSSGARDLSCYQDPSTAFGVGGDPSRRFSTTTALVNSVAAAQQPGPIMEPLPPKGAIRIISNNNIDGSTRRGSTTTATTNRSSALVAYGGSTRIGGSQMGGGSGSHHMSQSHRSHSSSRRHHHHHHSHRKQEVRAF